MFDGVTQGKVIGPIMFIGACLRQYKIPKRPDTFITVTQ